MQEQQPMQRSGMMGFWHFSRDQRGFTLLEAMSRMAILAILVGIGAPSFRATMERSRVTTIANDFLYHLQLARSEAVEAQSRNFIVPKQ
ncbi:MAG: prepilin-type N-terminal cleavage/methylation domain-containing protein [Chromatiales bacterium]|nr:prepilin-type N-terminal cleavage/methylation domain-containing protein [Chromatiales bacterium]